MNELKVFNYESKEIRTVIVNNEPWLVGKDVAEALGYSNPQKAIRDHIDEEDKTVNDSFSVNGTQGILINESGLYSLVMSSQLPSAKQFKRWITSEVLPSIRNNGGYIKNQEQLTPEQIVANALIVAQNIIKNQQTQLEEMKPKVEYADKMLKSKDNVLVREFAKVLCDEGYNIGEKRLYKLLKNNKYLMQDNEPYQRYIDNNTFVVKSGSVDTTFGVKQTRTTMITPQGQLYLFKKIANNELN